MQQLQDSGYIDIKVIQISTFYFKNNYNHKNLKYFSNFYNCSMLQIISVLCFCIGQSNNIIIIIIIIINNKIHDWIKWENLQ